MFSISYKEYFVACETDICYEGQFPLEEMIVEVVGKDIPVTCFMGNFSPAQAPTINIVWNEVYPTILKLMVLRKKYFQRMNKFEELFTSLKETFKSQEETPGIHLDGIEDISWEFIKWLTEKIA